MASLTDLPSLSPTQALLYSTPSFISSRTSLIYPIIPFPSHSPSNRRITCIHPNVRCSIAGESTVSPAKTGGQLNSGGNDSASVDCMIVGGKISGLYIAQALLQSYEPN
ncbi:hypothetical protein QN277_020836 [Acacia crassicarpa]|uniref:Uncharacterized protein n=1 Tax=Acacia crassicarpa TaxID=499986 RepID=A0AAE1JPV0_9FABA|nr:hypothetical protein QN277_020836 [Acacia crassicarpa]